MHRAVRQRIVGIGVLSFLVLLPAFSFASTTVTEAQVRAYFADVPVMAEIARCESEFRQYNSNGSVLEGGYGGGMLGVFQINKWVHAAAAAALGYDLHTREGNIAYARHLYESSGTTPWNASAHCWNDAASTIGAESDAELLVRITELLALIEKLQSILAMKELAMR